eukprot:NODE_1662_length_2408_cov_2.119246.p1 GENE.NODE_1662_length_2408_cov_2.119246~~NODE_1662_length_2408_cov_2.119246.p1  ORF type:complete len:615 (+),score=160.45 NODE_1662_length_2408_cov_2.119246:254-2098(+)
MSGQADGSEHRVADDGHWPSFNVRPGDLVFEFQHKPHAYLCQRAGGSLEITSRLVVRAKATDRGLSVWRPTFKNCMVLLRFFNPLLPLAQCKAVTIAFRAEGEGLPTPGDASSHGTLTAHVTVQLLGEALVPKLTGACCRDVLARRHVRRYNHQPQLTVSLSARSGVRGAPAVRCYVAEVAEGRDVSRVWLPASMVIWEAPAGTDVIAFTERANALGSHARWRPEGFGWGYCPGLFRRALVNAGHVRLSDAELLSEDEEEVIDLQPGGHGSSVGDTSIACGTSEGKADARRDAEMPSTGTAEEMPEEGEEAARPAIEEFLLRFGLGPPEGFPTRLAVATNGGRSSRGDSHASGRGRAGAAAVATAAVLLTSERETPEERENTRRIRELRTEMDLQRRQWNEKRERMHEARNADESTLHDLLEKDRLREIGRIEREMGTLRPKFENEVNVEDKWRNEFRKESSHVNEWKCIFQAGMVARQTPTEEGVIRKRIVFDEVVVAKGEVTSDQWIQLKSSDHWALTWHPKHGRLLQAWHGAKQPEFLQLEAKIDARRKNRNQTFIDFRQRKKEVNEWTIPVRGCPERRLFFCRDALCQPKPPCVARACLARSRRAFESDA